MKVQLDKTFPMPASADVAWSLLQDIDAVAGCMPGARITERVDPQHYKGTVAVKFGPASMTFRGEVEVQGLDPATRTLRLAGKGTDATGSSAATMTLSAHVDAVDAQSCQLAGASEVAVSGKAAAFGQRLMGSVAEQVLKQFADNFAARLRERQEQSNSTVESASTSAPAQQAASTSDADAAAPRIESRASQAVDPLPPTQPSTPALTTATTRPLSGFSLLWGAFKDWLHALFAGRAHRR